MKKLSIAALVIVIIFGLGYSQRETLITRLLERGMEVRMGGANYVDSLDDGLHVGLCGAGGPMPAPNASGPCVAVVAGDQFFTVDSGTDSVRNLGRMGYPIGGLDGVLITHFHSDHIDTLGELATLRWAGGDNQSPMPVYGPPGIERVVDGFNMAYAQDFNYRNEHHGDLVTPMSAAGSEARPFDLPADGELVRIHDRDGLTIDALAVGHSPVKPAVGYLFRYKGRSALVTGDTIKHPNIIQFSQGIDLLVHEALAPNIVMMMNAGAKSVGNPIMEKITIDILDYHASPMDAAETAKEAGVGHLLYYHIVPPLVVPGQELVFLDGAQDVFPDYTVGVDGVRFSMPANSDEIIKAHKGL